MDVHFVLKHSPVSNSVRLTYFVSADGREIFHTNMDREQFAEFANAVDLMRQGIEAWEAKQ